MTDWTLEWSWSDWLNVSFCKEGETPTIHQFYRQVQDPKYLEIIPALEELFEEQGTIMGHSLGETLVMHFPLCNVFAYFEKAYIMMASPHLGQLQLVADSKIIPEKTHKKCIYLLHMTSHGVELIHGGDMDKPLIEENYTPDTLEEIRSVIEWADAPNPYGRIVVFAGPPGTGKTHAVRSIVSATDNVQWVFIPPQCVSALARPDMVQILLREREGEGSMGLVIEDANSLLRDRRQNDDDLVGCLLNMGDGIPGDLADLRIILTTNCDRIQIDDALLRPGRLNSLIEFGLLPTDHANRLLKNLNPESELEFVDPVPLTEVYRLAYGKKPRKQPRKETGLGQYA